jgi:ribosomal protein S18 acetylase RimI-like enzyme
MSPIAVRQAVFADLDALVPLFDAYRQFYGQTGDLARARAFLGERFEHLQSVVLIAEDGDNAIGFTQLYPSFSSISMARTFVLNDLFVTPHCRRKGVGEMLLQAAAAFARNVGAVRLTLSTAVTNGPAQALYESAGWRRDEKFYVYNLATDA